MTMTDEKLLEIALAYGFGPAMLALGNSAVAGKPEQFLPMLRAVAAEARIAANGARPVATVRVKHGGYGMDLSKYIAYALPEGLHDLYAPCR